MFQGRCTICMMLGHGKIPDPAQWHSLDRCRHVQRRQCLQAKQRAIQRNHHRGGWLKKYIACFRCGNPQEICPVDDDRGQGGECEFRDLVLPAAWALFHCEHRWGRTLGQFSGVSSRFWEARNGGWTGSALNVSFEGSAHVKLPVSWTPSCLWRSGKARSRCTTNS